MAKKSKGKGNGSKTKKKTKAEITVTVKDEVELPVKNNEIIEDHDELVNKIQVLIKNTKIYLGVKNLDYAIKGGRVPKLKGLIAKALNMRPILSIDNEGKLKAESAVFGVKNFHNKFNFSMPAITKTTVDTMGAGDAFLSISSPYFI